MVRRRIIVFFLCFIFVLFYFGKQFFSDSAYGTDEIVGQVFKLDKRNPVFLATFFVIYPTAYFANVLFHFLSPFGLFVFDLFHKFKRRRVVLAYRTNEVGRQFFALENVAAHFANVRFLLWRNGLRLYVFLIFRISQRVEIGKHRRFFDGTNEHVVRAEIDCLLHRKGYERVAKLRHYDKPVFAPFRRFSEKLIDSFAALETESLENVKGRVDRQAVDVHFQRFQNRPARVILFVYANGDSQRIACDLHYAVYDAAVVFSSVVGGQNVQPVADSEQCGKVNFLFFVRHIYSPLFNSRCLFAPYTTADAPHKDA